MSITGVTGTGNPLKSNVSQEKIMEMGQRVSAAMKNGTIKKLEGFVTRGSSLPHYQDRFEGKTIVENKAPEPIVVRESFTPDGQYVDLAGYANDRAKAGAPTHGFVYQKTDFLIQAAKEYAKLDENEVFRNRSIDDAGFVRDALDFFTDGKYSSGETYALQEQMTDVVFELAQQIRNGESPDCK